MTDRRKSVRFKDNTFGGNVDDKMRGSITSSDGLAGTMISMEKSPSQERLVQLAIMRNAENTIMRGHSVLRQDSTLKSKRNFDLSGQSDPPGKLDPLGPLEDEEDEEATTTMWCCFKGNSKGEEQIVKEVDKKKLNMSFTKRAVRKVRDNRRSSVFERLRGPAALFEGANIEVSDFSRMQRLVMEMESSLSKLGNIPENDMLEDWACLIYESMSGASRTFHGVQHVFDISVNCDEVQKLCAFFHDSIYYTIDGGLSTTQNEYLNGIIVEKDKDVFLTKFFLEESMEMLIIIFGFEKGQKLNPFKGLNEFLSAALATRCFSTCLSNRYLAEVAACIEATIPFRGNKPMDGLYERLTKANKLFNLGMKEEEVEAAVQRAADFANRDLYNFTLSNKAVFLSNTWNLLPESNISLRNTRVFRVSDFTHALLKMTGFFNSLDPESLFHNFRSSPPDELITELTEKARVNIILASTYMNCKLLAISVLAAFAELTGGDAPVAMFLGDLPEPHHISPSIEDLIVPKKRHKNLTLDERVLALLRDGREGESDFDIKTSPMAAFIYSEIGDDGLKEAMTLLSHPMDKQHSKALLLSLPKRCVAEIGMACSHIAITRSNLLKDLVLKIQEDREI